MATKWLQGDEIEAFMENNHDGLRTPNNWTIFQIDSDDKGMITYHIRKLSSREERIVNVHELNTYFRLIRHTR